MQKTILALVAIFVGFNAQAASLDALSPAEKALNPISGTSSAVTDFRENGGNSRFSYWFGIAYSKYSLEFDGNDNVSAVELTTNSAVTVVQIRQAIDKLCGTESSLWKVKTVKSWFLGDVMEGVLENGMCNATYETADDGISRLTLSKIAR